MDHIIKQKLIESLKKPAVPEGWGYSKVGNQEIWTAPSQKAQPSTQTVQSSKQDQVEDSEGIQQSLSNLTNPQEKGRVSDQEFANMMPYPDASGWVGEYHKDDLMKQWESLRAKYDQDELDDIVMDMYEVMNGKSLGGSQEDEGAKFLGRAIQYGRMYGNE